VFKHQALKLYGDPSAQDVGDFTLQPPYPLGMRPRYLLPRMLNGPQSQSGRGGGERNLCL
jgi:hypothetical protein